MRRNPGDWMIRLLSLVLFAGLISAPAPVGAQKPWRTVYSDSDLTVLFDTATASRRPDGSWTTVTSWDYSRPRILENKKSYTRLVEKAHLRCTPSRVKRVRSTLYGPNNAMVRDEGEVPDDDQSHMVWDKLRTGSSNSRAFDAVCGVLTKKTPVRAAAVKAPVKKAPVKKAPVKRRTGE